MLLTLACGLVPSVAAAQAGETRGQQLFREGKAAMAQKDYDAACAKFQASYAEEKALGPLLNHANCEETRNKRADALELWKLAVIATQPGTEERRFADERVGTLEALLPKLAIRWSERVPDGARVDVGGRAWVADGAPRAIDPGTHDVVATVGEAKITERITLAERESREVVLRSPPQASPGSGPPAAALPVADGSASPAWIAGWVIGGVGVASLVGFGVTGGIILGKSSEWADAGCDTRAPTGDCAAIKPGTGLWVANGVLLGAGIAGLGVGAILVGTQWPSESATVAPGPGDAGLSLRVGF